MPSGVGVNEVLCAAFFQESAYSFSRKRVLLFKSAYSFSRAGVVGVELEDTFVFGGVFFHFNGELFFGFGGG